MKIIDSFMFFDENMLLDLRLNILDNYVSKFIVCESTYSHSGKKKKLNFDINNFPKFRSKIEYIVSDKEPDNLKIIKNEDSIALKESKTLDNALIRENFQRNFAQKKLLEADDNDLILINDLDEIPDLSNFSYNKKITIFKQKMLYFKLNLIYKNLSWTGSKICKKKDFINPQWLRNIKTRKYPLWRLDIFFSNKKYNDIKVIKNGGWHFTNIKTAEEIHNKMKNFLHHYEYESSGLNSQNIDKFIKDKKALYNYSADQKSDKWTNNAELEKINLDYLPKYISENQLKYKDWLS